MSLPVNIPILKHAEEAKAQGIKLKDSTPICVIVVGMAGSGKTTLMTALQRSFDNTSQQEQDQQQEQQQQQDESKIIVSPHRRGYCLNLDPATKLVPYDASIDIRDVVDYQVRKYEIFIYTHPQCITWYM